MTETEIQHGNLPEFNQPSHDSLGLGRTPSHRSAEIVAGARAEILRTPETTALARYSGRFFAQLIRRLGGNFNLIELFVSRMIGIEALVKRHLPQQTDGVLVVDVASGFSPRALRLAKEHPQVKVIEIDLPEILAEKRSRLNKANIELPPNLTWIEADLGSTNISDLLDGRKANIITSEGLTLYLTPAELERLFSQARDSLVDGGLIIAEVYYETKLTMIRQNPQTNSAMSMVLRQIGRTPGILYDAQVAKGLFERSGLAVMKEYPLVDLMAELKEISTVDVVSIYVTQKQAASSVPTAPSWTKTTPDKPMD